MAVASNLAGVQLRRDWRPLVTLTVLAAVASGLAMAGVAGARRTASVLDRAVERPTVVHALSTAVRRRRRDLAVLEVLGASRRALRFVGIFQALTVAVIAVIIGVPLGLVTGRAAWSALAAAYGTAAEPVVPLGKLALAAAAIVIVAAVAGWFPTARAVRHRPAETLRAE
jgi:putative ABC transport system permease protein